MPTYEIVVERVDTSKCEGTLIFLIDGSKKRETTCWENPGNLIDAKHYTECSTTIMASKGYKSVYLPDSQTGKTGIFIHQGSKPEHSDGCIVCDKDVVQYIYNTVPRDARNITVKVS